MVIIIDHHMARWPRTRHQVIGREQRHRGINGNRHQVVARQPIAPPRGPGRNRHMLEAEAQDVVDRQLRVTIDIHIGHLGYLPHAIVAHPRPGIEAGKPRFA